MAKTSRYVSLGLPLALLWHAVKDRRGSGPGHLLDFYMEVSIQSTKFALNDNHRWGGGDVQSRSIIGIDPCIHKSQRNTDCGCPWHRDSEQST